MNAIERFISQKIPRTKLENFNYRYTALLLGLGFLLLPLAPVVGRTVNGGRLWVESTFGAGSKFLLTIPAAQ